MDRHLLPEEFDLLLDGEGGFGVAPLRAHVRGCAECQVELEAAQLVTAELDRMPHFAPPPQFADRVLQQVQVFEPWHVALGDSARALVPATRPARALAALAAGSAAVVLWVATLWIAARVDVLAFLGALAFERAQGAARAALGSAAQALLGTGIQEGDATLLLLALGAFLVTAVGATAGLRAVAATARRPE